MGVKGDKDQQQIKLSMVRRLWRQRVASPNSQQYTELGRHWRSTRVKIMSKKLAHSPPACEQGSAAGSLR